MATFEFPHLLRLIEQSQFDTIYHEHFSYLSLGVVAELMKRKGLRVFDVEELADPWRIAAGVRLPRRRLASVGRPTVDRVLAAGTRGQSARSLRICRLRGDMSSSIKCRTLEFLIKARDEGKIVCGYGAAAKGNTFSELLRHRAGTHRGRRRPLPAQAKHAAAGKPHPRRFAARNAGAAARLRRDPAVESEGGDCRAD